jgi:hypothetical protein
VKTTSVSECVTAEMIACSIPVSCTQVPSSSENVERAWIRTPWFLASSTDRSINTFAPEAAISSISSYDTTGSLLACGTSRGSAVKTPGTSE